MKAKLSKIEGETPRARKPLNLRKLRIGATATAVTVAVVVLVLLLNVVMRLLNERFPLVLDVTADKAFTLSEQSRTVAAAVDKDVAITVFAQETQLSNPSFGSDLDIIARQFYQFSKDYSTLTKGKVKVEYVDLEGDPTKLTAYSDYNISTGSILFRCEALYRTITLDDLYVMDDSNYQYTGEYSITSKVEQMLAANINAVVSGNSKTVTFLTGHSEYTGVITSLKNLYELNGYLTEQIDYTTAAAKISDSTGVVVIAAPAADYTVDEISRLRKWLLNDGKRNRHLLVLCNPAAVGKCTNLYEFLQEDYGIEVTDKLIAETNENNVPAGMGEYYPLSQIGLTELTVDVSEKTVVMPVTLQLKLHYDADIEKNALTNHAVVSFEETAKLVDAQMVAENKTPTKADAETYPVVGMAYAYDYDFDSENKPVSNYVLVSGSCLSANFVTNALYENEDMFVYPMRTMCDLGDTLVISGRTTTNTLLYFSELTGDILGIGVFTVGIPAVVLILGLVVFFKRRHL